MSSGLLPPAAALFAILLGVAALIRKHRSFATWCFFCGMTGLAVEALFSGLSLRSSSPQEVISWQTLALIMRSLLPAIWLCFTLSYARGNYRQFLRRSRYVLAAAFLLPVGLAIGFRSELLYLEPSVQAGESWWLAFGPAAKALNILLLLSTVLILMNLETTFKAAVGTMRWRIKFLVLGLAVIFGTRIYTSSQALLFSGHSLALVGVETGALLIGCTLITIAYLRSGFSEIDVYPSQAVLRSSVTVLLAGGYLLVVGVLAQIIARLGGIGNFQVQAFLILLGGATLATLLLSDRLRQAIQHSLSRHFKTPQHDFRKVWTLFTQSMSSRLDQNDLCNATAKLISELFNVLSVTIWLADQQKEGLVCGASTSQSQRDASASGESLADAHSVLHAVQAIGYPFDLETRQGAWAEKLRQISSTQFRKGGNRVCIPLVAGDLELGVVLLADRVNGVPYSVEELDLLKCIGDQIAAGLLNVRLTKELMLTKEMNAFQTMSTFFVHDLKNAASSLSLMLQNLPVHFDNPSFREDALRGIGNTVGRINQLIERLSALRHTLDPKPDGFDLNELVREALGALDGSSEVELIQRLDPVPAVFGDRQQIHTVVTNLLLNANDAVSPRGRITVQTTRREGCAFLTVADDGCGMSSAFVQDSLFRPFLTTKKKGLGIGMFQSKMMVEANRGQIQVESALGKGTTFRVMLPLKPQL